MSSKKASTRRMGVENSEIRAQLIEAAAQLLRKEGWAAVTARRLAEVIGLKRQIVHYYFGTIDDLLIALIRRDSEKVHRHLKRALESGDPLKVVWEIGMKARTTIFELSAMASRRKSVRNEMKNYMEEFRRIQTEALVRHLELRGMKLPVPPIVAALMISSISYTLASERSLEVTGGHAETIAVIEDWLKTFAAQSEAPSLRSQSRSA